MYSRRLPVYLLLDCSESLAGEPIQAVAEGVAALIGDLRGDPMALETVYLSVITFANKAEVVAPLTELLKFQPPVLRMGSGTALGAALRLLVKCLNEDVVQSSATQKGDWKPVVLILTDGEPTDDWEGLADRVRTTIVGKKANVIGIACGPDAAVESLKRITETVLRAADLQPGTLRALFKWVSASVSTASHRLEGGTQLPPMPGSDLEVVTGKGPRVIPDRYVFLHAKCQKTRKFYIMRFEKQGRNYEAVAAHQVDDFDFGEDSDLKVSVDRLGPPPSCPTCKNPTVSMCECGKLFCAPEIRRPITLTCPWCKTSGTYSPAGASFDIGRGSG